MNISEIMQTVREDYLENPVPLTDFQTPDDLKNAPFLCPFTMTEQEWKSKYPLIDSKRIYYSGAHFGVIFYYEPENCILIDLTSYLLQGEEKAQSAFQWRRQDIMQAIQVREYFRAVSQLENATLLHMARDIILTQPLSPALYQFFLDVYTHADSGAGLFSEGVVRRLMESKSAEQKAITAEALRDFPEEITIYRGEGSASTPADRAFSWTTSRKVALHFAVFYSGSQYRVITAKVKKADVVERFTQRDEEELILLPSTVYDKKTEYLLTTEELVGRKPEPWDEAQEFIDEYRESPLLLKDVESHGSSHSQRVTFLASYLAEHEKVRVYREELLLAALFHDCGREDGGENDAHGAKGYGLYREKYGEDAAVGFLITYLCKSDEEAKAALPDCENPADLWKAYCVLKDADALDRIRLPLEKKKMDHDLIHFLYTEKLAGFASELLQFYRI